MRRHKAMRTMEKTAPRSTRRAGGFYLRTPQTRPRGKERTDSTDAVYVVKVETRDGVHSGHPLVIPAALAVNECYRTKARARFSMLEIAKATAAMEIARAGRRPSPASLNMIPNFTEDITSYDVLTADGLILRYKIEPMPLV